MSAMFVYIRHDMLKLTLISNKYSSISNTNSVHVPWTLDVLLVHTDTVLITIRIVLLLLLIFKPKI